MTALPITVGCSSPEAFGGSRLAAETWAAERGFSPVRLKAGAFDLAAFVRQSSDAAAAATIYIEGDGAAWPTPYHPPRDPTPLKPIALALAAGDPTPAVAYLGRPCQYLDTAALASCSSAYWTNKRFAPEVLDSFDNAIDELKARLKANRIRLVGYSGGGVIATLIASRRRDVESLITVAAPLAVGEWTKWHGASALVGSLDPAALNVFAPVGVHLVGGDDKTVPGAVVERFVRLKGGRIETLAGFDHECCWTRDWPTLLRRALVQEVTK